MYSNLQVLFYKYLEAIQDAKAPPPIAAAMRGAGGRERAIMLTPAYPAKPAPKGSKKALLV